jgi:hypothetical protein
MPSFVHQAAVAHLADLIDAIGELIAAILDMNGSLGIGGISPIDVHNPSHGI